MDLYDGLKLPKKTKRERQDEMQQQQRAELIAIDTVPVKRRKTPLDLSAMVAKLEGYMARCDMMMVHGCVSS